MADAQEAAFAVGIDLGTTHCAIASTACAEGSSGPPAPLPVPQVVHPGEVMALPLLPSFLYLPSDVELPAGALALPWDPTARDVVGTFAQAQGALTPMRWVSSAKSWLSYAGVDRRAGILPWGAPSEVPRLSPLAASARYLGHLRSAWDTAHPDDPLNEQDVVLTVPASFDAVARELTVEAAREAGLGASLRLLEEPQAALYAWLADRGTQWRHEVTVGDLILVFDVGGGTTDFSLIAVCDRDGTLELERVAVGDHILLGGDNMDLALAFAVRHRLQEQGTELDDWQMRSLTQGCREAKEALFSDPSRESYPLTIPSRGSRLVGGSLRVELDREELSRVVLEGFFPIVPATARPRTVRRVGLTTLGLPYASDAAVTRHLAAFLGRQSTSRLDGREMAVPTAILFNGGVTRSPVIRERCCALLRAWAEAEGVEPPRVLEGTDPDVAVSRGAAYYAGVRRQGGVRIRGGTAQAYYVGVERLELAVPGVPPGLDAVCVAPFGMEEGSVTVLQQPLGLVVGEPVSFRFFGSSERRDDVVGTIVSPNELIELSPVETTVEGEPGAFSEVRLHARVTEVGTLDLSAVDVGSNRRFDVSFDVRVR